MPSTVTIDYIHLGPVGLRVHEGPNNLVARSMQYVLLRVHDALYIRPLHRKEITNKLSMKDPAIWYRATLLLHLHDAMYAGGETRYESHRPCSMLGLSRYIQAHSDIPSRFVYFRITSTLPDGYLTHLLLSYSRGTPNHVQITIHGTFTISIFDPSSDLGCG